jgi:hypothetical protein
MVALKLVAMGTKSTLAKLAASRLMNENPSLFGKAEFKIDLKPAVAVETAMILQEGSAAYRITATKRKKGAPSGRRT